MQVDVVIPTMRPDFVRTTLYSLSKNTVKPDMVTIVSNEIKENLSCYGLKIRLVRFGSSYYPVGYLDVVLRRNIGIWSSTCSHIITFDDDQIAPNNMIQKSIELLSRRPYFWGHHRYINFSKYQVDEIIQMPPEKGRSRENPANAWHSWLSCYGGLFGAERALIQRLGGFDMVFCGKHGGEDQNLGRRIARNIDQRDRVFIYEPPFAWHPEEKIPWSISSSNLCPSKHQLLRSSYEGLVIEKCVFCPFFRIVSGQINRDNVIMKFDPSKVDIIIE
jgi:hypothetical protein